VDVWLELFRECHAGDAVSILVGNKVDKKEQREVEREEGAEKAK
jgi:GTPase SAR1 family protein